MEISEEDFHNLQFLFRNVYLNKEKILGILKKHEFYSNGVSQIIDFIIKINNNEFSFDFLRVGAYRHFYNFRIEEPTRLLLYFKKCDRTRACYLHEHSECPFYVYDDDKEKTNEISKISETIDFIYSNTYYRLIPVYFLRLL